ncbi:MAG: MarR family transcriptional regulator [Clostridiales bacterium]|nr:MarR family transcriptional regulator [Clostridiales bacterium]
MDNLEEILVELLCKTYNKIIYHEEKILKDMIGDSLSLKEFHTVDVIYDAMAQKTNTASNIAKALGITQGTLTINIDRLVSKGYVHKVKNENDRRVTYIELTAAGHQIRQKHNIIHKKLVEESIRNLSTSEKVALVNAITKLDI